MHFIYQVPKMDFFLVQNTKINVLIRCENGMVQVCIDIGTFACNGFNGRIIDIAYLFSKPKIVSITWDVDGKQVSKQTKQRIICGDVCESYPIRSEMSTSFTFITLHLDIYSVHTMCWLDAVFTMLMDVWIADKTRCFFFALSWIKRMTCIFSNGKQSFLFQITF